MIGSTAAEVLKLRKRVSTWILVGILVALLILLTYGLDYLIFRNPPRGSNAGAGRSFDQLKLILYPADFLRTVLSSLTGLGGAIALILGVLSMGSEYGWGTVKTMFTQRPGRLTVLAGKALGLALLLVLVDVLLFGAGAVCSYAIASLDGKPASWPSPAEIARGLGAGWLILALWTALGMALSTLFRQSALAIGIGLLYSIILENLVFALFGQSDTLKPWEKLFPGANATALASSFHSALPGSATPLVGGSQAALVIAAYILLFAVVSGALVKRRDVI